MKEIRYNIGNIPVIQVMNWGVKNSMDIWRRFRVLCTVIAAMSLCLVSHAFAGEKEDITIAVSIPGPDHEWTQDVATYAREELDLLEDKYGWETILISADSSYEQSQQVVDLVTQDVDCIILQPVDGSSLKTAAIAVQRADIPLVIFDREIPEFAPSATVKGDNRGIGEASATIINNAFPEGTTVLELMGDTSTVPFLRTDGFDTVLNENNRKIQVGYTEWQRSVTRDLFYQWIAKQNEKTTSTVGAIYTHDDEIALGVLDILDKMREAGTVDQIFPNLKIIIGSSSLQRMYQRIESEENYRLISMTYNASMIQEAIDVGSRILRQEDYEEMTIFPTETVSKKNVEAFIDPDYTEEPMTE